MEKSWVGFRFFTSNVGHLSGFGRFKKKNETELNISRSVPQGNQPPNGQHFEDFGVNV